jgi:hypothetical protein
MFIRKNPGRFPGFFLGIITCPQGPLQTGSRIFSFFATWLTPFSKPASDKGLINGFTRSVSASTRYNRQMNKGCNDHQGQKEKNHRRDTKK